MSQQGTGAMSAGELKQGIKQDVDQLRDDLGKLKKDVAGTARDLAGAARSGAREAGAYVTDAMDTARERGEETLDSAREAIRENPFAATAIAFGVGVLLGALIRRL
jgi:ElaB/YqjD/DUF883 family membrane-anchored ribosome-binding protein